MNAAETEGQEKKQPTGHPRAFWFIFWGEFAERYSFYGMRAILPLYMTAQLGMSDGSAAFWYSAFKMACYFLPLLGGYLADRYFGKYWTIVAFSVPYVVGQFLIGTVEHFSPGFQRDDKCGRVFDSKNEMSEDVRDREADDRPVLADEAVGEKSAEEGQEIDRHFEAVIGRIVVGIVEHAG